MKNDILVTRSSMPELDEYVSEIADLFESHWLTNMGVKHQVLERELCSYLGVPNVSLFVNGHNALETVIEGMGLEGDVITTPFTFASTAHALVRKGLNPIFCDIRQDDYTLDPSLLESVITENTCAIVPVHVYGQICDVDAIRKFADAHGLRVIYDAAHAFGEVKDGKGVGTFGDASMFSFHATKVFNTIEGGAIATGNAELCGRLSSLKNFGQSGKEDCEFVGGNSKMNEFAAAMGLCNLRHVAEEIQKRSAVASWYVERLCGIEGITLCKSQEGVESNYSYFPAYFDSALLGFTRDDVFEALAAAGIGARKYFYPLVSDFSCYKDRYDSSATPVAQRVSRGILTLPMYADLRREEVDAVCDVIVSLLSR